MAPAKAKVKGVNVPSRLEHRAWRICRNHMNTDCKELKNARVDASVKVRMGRSIDE